ncbi:MAG: class I SAM-dependent methyltransferase [Candidatus Competibacteraceae bacterium]
MSANPYDVVDYPGHIRPLAHPRRLQTNARLFGLHAPALESCRVLELGCGDGVHLLWMAAEFEGARCVGVDLAAGGLAKGREIVHTLGLRNIELVQTDILDIDEGFGEFDYIIAHGVYSWVPDVVRDKLLAICRRNLAPNGVAYVSYNTFPGCHLRHLLGEMINFHVRALEEPHARVAEARRFAALLPGWAKASELYRAVLEDEQKFLAKMSDQVLYHDDLAEFNVPVYFTDFLQQASRHQLQYLTEATLKEAAQFDQWPDVAAAVERWTASRAEREQYFDFVTARRFRTTLLCHAEQPLQEQPDPAAVQDLTVAGDLKFELESAADLVTDKIVEFRGQGDKAVAVRDATHKVALARIASLWPRAVSFTDLWAHVESSARLPAAQQEELQAQLCETLLKCYRSGVVELAVTPVRVATTPGDRPQASALARGQALLGQRITSLYGHRVNISDDFSRFFLQLLDGSRTRAEIAAALIAAVAQGKVKPPPPVAAAMGSGRWKMLIKAGLDDNLKHLARIALLEA